jgi:curved DNA-binding protein CbpA
MRGVISNHYAVLGVPQTADRRDIQRAYRALARRTHPDFGGDESAMARINEAWHVLSDPGRRAAYDGKPRQTLPQRPARRDGTTVLDFGRYQGWSLRDIANADEDYLDWLTRTPIGRPLRPEISRILTERAEAADALRPTPQKPARHGRRLWRTR